MPRRAAAPFPELDIQAGPLGIDASHGPEFRIDRPHGSRDWLLLHFPTPMRIRDRHGERATRADACILYSPHHPQWYCALGRGMVNHYTHLRGEGVAPLVARLGLPVDEVVYPRPVEFIAARIHEMLRERMRDDAHAKVAFAGLAMALLAAFGRALDGSASPAPPRQRSARERVGDVRARMRAEPWLRWSAAGMARLAKLSASRFRVLYRQLHRAGAKNELIALRLAHARRLLVDAPAPIASIAATCGFSDPQYFSRVFRAQVGVTPSDYAVSKRAVPKRAKAGRR